MQSRSLRLRRCWGRTNFVILFNPMAAAATFPPFPTGDYRVVYLFITATKVDTMETVFIPNGLTLSVKEKNQTEPIILGTTSDGQTGHGEQFPGTINIRFSRGLVSPELPQIIKIVPPLRSSTRMKTPIDRFTFNKKRQTRRNRRNSRSKPRRLQ